MAVEVRPLGIQCNLACRYCYQNAQRSAGNTYNAYDIDTMKDSILKIRNVKRFILFGGEPLLVPKSDLEKLWSWGFEKFKTNSMQSNGTLINDEFIEMFKKYNVKPGISIDGPGKLNDIRWAGTLKKTREATQKTENAIKRLCEEKMYPGMIVTLHKGNARKKHLSAMCQWFQKLDQMGITSVRLHVLEVPNEKLRNSLALSIQENIEAHLCFAELETKLKHLKFDIFQDIKRLLVAKDHNITCTWSSCDPYTTSAVDGVEGNGQRTNCGRENKDGIDNRKSGTPGYERYQALYHTPQEYGGCKDCRFFLMCKGQCPGTAIDQDWRNKTEHCEMWFALFEHFEKELISKGVTPISQQPNLYLLENAMLNIWASGSNIPMQAILEQLEQTSNQEMESSNQEVEPLKN